MKNIVRYVMVCVFTLFITIVADSSLFLFLFAVELLVPPVLYIQARYLSGRLRIELYPSGMIAKGEEADAVIQICNDSWLPVSYAVIELAVEDVFEGTQELQEMACMIDARGVTEVAVKLKADYAGMLLLRPKRLRVWDYLRLFSKKVHLPEASEQIVVGPDTFAIGTSENRMYGGRRASGSQTLSNVIGDDSSEVLDTRSYQEGDTLHQIHWKLSAKMDELLVKVYSASADRAVCICMDWYRKTDGNWSHEQFDRLMTIMTSLSYFLSEHQVRHTVLWYEVRDERLCAKEISSFHDVFGIVGALAGVPTYSDRNVSERVLGEMETYAENASCIRLDTDLCLFWQEKCLASFAGKDLEQELGRLKIE